ncbi:MAG: ABC transporter substrate-binding protein/permease [Victivallaceae bacterium]|nr:ABC transporter substrate-binding protein/permease [Victivallaceae bacterium]
MSLKSKMLRVLAAVLVPSLMLAMVSGCGKSGKKRTLVMVCNAAFPPFELVREGEIGGIDPDIVREICERNDYELKIEDMPFGSVIAAVQTGKADVAASGITVTDERRKMIDFTDPYVTARQRIMVRKDAGEFSIECLDTNLIGVQEGTTGDMFVTKHYREPERYKNVPEVVQALKTRKVNAVVVDEEPARAEAAANPDLVLLSVPLATEDYAFGISKRRPDLLNMFNVTLRQMKADGTLDRIIAEARIRCASNDADAFDGGLLDRIKADFKLNFVNGNRYRYLLNGFGVTMLVTVLSVLLGILLGFLVAIVRSTHDMTGTHVVADAVCRCYLVVIRGTPVVIQLLIIYFVIFCSLDVSKILVAVTAFGINSGAYTAEIIRAGIMSLDRGQIEAGRSLGLSYRQTMLRVILPQALRNVLPALGNEFIVLLKETSVSGFIALEDLAKGGDIIRSQTYNAFLPLMAVAVIYLAVVMFFSRLLGNLERGLQKKNRK